MLGNVIEKFGSRKPLRLLQVSYRVKDDRQSSGFLDNERNDIPLFQRGVKQEAQPAEAKKLTTKMTFRDSSAFFFSLDA